MKKKLSYLLSSLIFLILLIFIKAPHANALLIEGGSSGGTACGVGTRYICLTDGNQGTPDTTWETKITILNSSGSIVYGPVNRYTGDDGSVALIYAGGRVLQSTDTIKWLTACVDPEDNIRSFLDVSCRSYDADSPSTCFGTTCGIVYGACGGYNNYPSAGSTGGLSLYATGYGPVAYNRLCPIPNDNPGRDTQSTENKFRCVYAGNTASGVNYVGCRNTCSYRYCTSSGGYGVFATTSYSSRCGTGNSCAPPPPTITATPSCVNNAARISTTWSTVSYANGVDDFRYKRSVDTDWITDLDAPEPKVVSGLADNTVYNIQVRSHTTSGHAGPTDWASVNVTTGACSTPNLTITSLSVPDGTAGSSGNASVTILNNGALATNAGFSVGFLRDGSSASCSTTYSGEVTTTALGAGASRTVSVPFTHSSTIGSHTGVAMVDSNCGITESNEADNTRTDIYSVTGYTISGNVYVDANNNGVKDTGEVNYSGATLTLSGAGTGTTTTNTSGNYSFTRGPGTYTVTLTAPSGYTAPVPSANVTIGPNATANFRLVPVSTLTIHVYNDFNGNGVEDAVDTDSGGRIVTINGTNLSSATLPGNCTRVSSSSLSCTTYSNGNIIVSNIVAGGTTNTLTIPQNWTSTTTNPRPVSLPPSQIVNFGIRPPTPTCTSLTANPTSVGAGGNSTLTCNNPTSPTGDPLTFNWYPDTAISGFSDSVNPTSSTTNTTQWAAPNPWWTQVTANPSVQVCNPGGVCSAYQTAITVVPRFTISGNVFVDDNKDGLKTGSEANYTSGTSTIDIRTGSCGGPLVQRINSANGVFTSGQNLLGGTYYICYTNKPSTYQMTEPINGPPASFSVTVGNASTGGACNAGGSKSGACDANGNIANLNFGITNSVPWIQTTSGDVYYPSGSQIPDNNPTCGPYMSLRGSGGTPGIINCAGSTCNFGAGQASQNPYNWQIGPPNTSTYTPKSAELITSYNSMLARAQQSGITPTPLGSSQCGAGGISNCVLAAGLANGVYIANGNLTLTGASYTLGANRDVVILVNGDLNINTEFHVPVGSTALFSVSGNINVASTVGELVATSLRSNVEGYYSTDRNFNVLGTNSCPTADRRLNVAGSVVINAALTGGSLNYDRDLCANNLQCPIFMVLERPDFVLNAPDFFKTTRRIWQEIAP